MIASEMIHFDIRHDELHLVLALMVLTRHLCDDQHVHSEAEFHEDVALIHRHFDGLEQEDGFKIFLERLETSHAVLCNPSRTNEERVADLKNQAQITFTKGEVLALVGYESLAAAVLNSHVSDDLKSAAAEQAYGICEDLGIEAVLKLRGKLFTALRSVAPNVKHIRVDADGQ